LDIQGFSTYLYLGGALLFGAFALYKCFEQLLSPPMPHLFEHETVIKRVSIRFNITRQNAGLLYLTNSRLIVCPYTFPVGWGGPDIALNLRSIDSIMLDKSSSWPLRRILVKTYDNEEFKFYMSDLFQLGKPRRQLAFIDLVSSLVPRG
jgi:hypothetical protein